MPKSCVVVGCHKHNLSSDKKRCYFELPKRHKSPERRDKWLAAIKRVNPDGTHWSPTKYLTICSDHFVTGRPVKNDPLHPDYVPSIFPHIPGSADGANASLKRYKRCSSSSSKRHCPQDDVDSDTAESADVAEVSDSETESAYSCDEGPHDLDLDYQSISDSDTTHHKEHDPTVKQLLDAQQEINKQLSVHLELLQEENSSLRDKITSLEEALGKAQLSASKVEGDDKACKFFTGLSWSVFQKTFEFLLPHVLHGRAKNSLSFKDQFFLTLVRLRLDLSFELLAYLSASGRSTIVDYFWRWIDLMNAKLKFLVHWPDPESIIRTLPPEFKHKFPRLTAIIDCFEIFIDTPGNLHARQQTYSNYKKHTTAKVLIACSPLGAITYLSLAWGGRVSDVELVRQSGFISPTRHRPGDQILADRGFPMEDDFAALCSAELIIPAFTRGKTQLSAEEVETSREKSAVRIHIERVIGHLKKRYTILQGTLPIRMIKSLKDEADDASLASIDRLLTVCASLTNLGGSIVFKG